MILPLGCSGDDSSKSDADGSIDQAVDAEPGSDATVADNSAMDVANDQSPNEDQSGECDLGVPPWTGGLGQGQDDALFEFESANKKVVVKFVRTYVEWGVGESAIYANAGFLLQGDGRSVCIKDAASLDYSNSHHNWRDQAVAKDGQTTYLLDLTFDTMAMPEPKWLFAVSAVENEQTVWGPIDLIKTSGPERQ
jgi:hypothetical protein